MWYKNNLIIVYKWNSTTPHIQFGLFLVNHYIMWSGGSWSKLLKMAN
jgi:hypothetical protein